MLSLAHKLPPPGTQVPDALPSALEELRPANCPQIHKHHAAWHPFLPVLLIAWLAGGSLAFRDWKLFFAEFDSTLDMPLPAATPVSKSPWESPIVDLTGTDDPVPSASPMPARESLSLDVTAPVNRETGRTPDALPLVLNRFLTLLNTADKKKVGGLARAFHLAVQLAGCGVPNFPHDSLRRQWEHLWASLPLRPTVTQAVAYFVKAHPQDDPSVPAAGQHPAVQAHKSNQSTGSRRSGGWAHSDLADFRWAAMSNGLLSQTPLPNPCVREC